MRFKLLADHAMANTVLVAGTEIGDGTNYPLDDKWNPSSAMEPLDAEARTRLDKWMNRHEGQKLKTMPDVGLGDDGPKVLHKEPAAKPVMATPASVPQGQGSHVELPNQGPGISGPDNRPGQGPRSAPGAIKPSV